MIVTPGSRIGPYQVSEQIGAGGMGEVFRAVDLNLGRTAALKVLPASLATDPDRLARFEREAQTLASLNHPNIAQVFGFEKGEGDRKSTRLNSSHGYISYAVFCLKKKKTKIGRAKAVMS